MMTAPVTYFRQAQLDEAITALGAQLRREPGNDQARTFLFELLCFAGQFDRADKQLDVLAAQCEKAAPGVSVLKGLLCAHRQREGAFAFNRGTPDSSLSVTPLMRVTWNNADDAEVCSDEDDRIGAFFEVYASGEYSRVSLADLEEVMAEPPTSLRDLLWFPVKLKYRIGRIVAAHLPALAPLSWQHADAQVRLGRASVLEEEAEGSSVPFGAKLLLHGDRYVPLVDLRSLRMHAAPDEPIAIDVQGRAS